MTAEDDVMATNCEGKQVTHSEALEIVRRNDDDRRRNKEVPEHRAVVEAGGGEYVRGMLGDLVLFNSPATGSTLAVKESLLTAEEVARKILVSNQSFGK